MAQPTLRDPPMANTQQLMQSTSDTPLDAPKQPGTLSRVLMLAHSFPPSAGAGVFRTLRFAKYLDRFGWQPLVLTVQPSSSDQRVDEALLREVPATAIVRRTSIRYPDDAFDGLLKWFNHGSKKTASATSTSAAPRGAGQRAQSAKATRNRPLVNVVRSAWQWMWQTPDRAVWWKRPALQAAREMIAQYEPKLIYSTSPPHSTHLIAAKIKRMTGLPWVMDFRDPWARQPWGEKRTNPWGQRAFGRFERNCVEQADAVLLNTQRMRDEFQSHYDDLPSDKFVAIANGYDPDLRARIEDCLSTRSAARTEGRIRLCHPGSLYGRRDPGPLLAAIEHLAAEGTRVEFEQIGPVSDRFSVQSMAQRRGLEDQVTLLATMPHASVLERMADADLLLVIQPDTDLQVPAKLFEMVLYPTPIVALTGEGETADIVKTFNLGTVGRPDDARDIAKAIKEAAAMRSVAADDRERVLAAYDGIRLTSELAGVLDRVSECAARRSSTQPANPT